MNSTQCQVLSVLPSLCHQYRVTSVVTCSYPTFPSFPMRGWWHVSQCSSWKSHTCQTTEEAELLAHQIQCIKMDLVTKWHILHRRWQLLTWTVSGKAQSERSENCCQTEVGKVNGQILVIPMLLPWTVPGSSEPNTNRCIKYSHFPSLTLPPHAHHSSCGSYN